MAEEQKQEAPKQEAPKQRAFGNEDESIIWIPVDYRDPIIEHPHHAQKGENIVTCRADIMNPKDRIGEKIICPGCTQEFVIRMKP